MIYRISIILYPYNYRIEKFDGYAAPLCWEIVHFEAKISNILGLYHMYLIYD